MKQNWKKYLFVLVNLLLFIGLLFLPYIEIDGINKNAVEILFNGTFTWISLFISLPFVLYILGISSFIIIKKKPIITVISMLMFLIAGFLFISTISFVAFAHEIDEELLKLSYGAIVLAILSFAYTFITNSFLISSARFTVKDIVECAMLVAMAIVLDLPFLKFKIVPNGGSISLAMLPLIIASLRQGPVKGFVVSGIVYGFINCLIDGYGFISFPFDYLLGFGSLGLVGLFRSYIFPKDKKNYSLKAVIFMIVALIVAGSGRIIASTISGSLIYGLTFVDSLIYQLLYIPASIGLCLVALILLYRPLQVINQLYPLHTNSSIS
ncbi:MAG: energy-coupled thiamine transporter ThiT [Erysipelotrichaceae bacterium]|jgi:thiamine transporter|nr:energy-coupled thiamine transporter ThiT [Erysipelotrichaceae bacterium]